MYNIDMDECVFCKIAKGDIPAHKVYEDDSVLAFLDVKPVNPGHTMVIPKNHVDEFQEMSEDLYDHVMEVAHQLSRKVKTVFKPERVGLMVYGYGVPHAHIHVIPLHGPKDMPQPKQQEISKDEQAAIAKKLSS
jgi:histidine triad (HIT) family protein